MALEAVRTEKLVPTIFASIGAPAGMWGRDRDGLAQIHELVKAESGGLYDAAVNVELEAAILALDGLRDEAAAAFRDAVGRFEAQGAHFMAAHAALGAVLLVGPDHPAVAGLVATARAVFEWCGARPSLERLDAAVGAARSADAVSAG